MLAKYFNTIRSGLITCCSGYAWMVAIRFFGLHLKLFERSKTMSFASDNCVSSGYFIEIYIINRTLHAR